MSDQEPIGPDVRQRPYAGDKILAASDLRKCGLLFTLGSVVFVVVGLFCLLGGVERLLDLQDSQSREEVQASFLIWPASLAYFWPLTIPLGTYLVIARWTGDKHFRHA